jgi:clan AA aspartic protease
MGMTSVHAKVANPADHSKFIEEEFLVDSGAIYTVLPEELLSKIGIKPNRQMTFELADRTKIVREVGDAHYILDESQGSAPVVFGKRGDSLLLGAFTLEALGLILDPIRRKLRPMKVLNL